MPRVLFISRKWPPAIGGMETYARKLVEALSTRCELSTKVLPGRKGGGVPPPWKLMAFLIEAMAKAARHRVDVLHVGDLVLWPVALAAWWRGSARRVVITAYGLDIIYGHRRGIVPAIYGVYLAMAARLLGKHVRIIAISHDTARLCREAGFRDVVVVTLGVDEPNLAETASVARDHAPFVLFAGRLVRRKGAAWFAHQVMPLLPGDMRFVVVGKAWDTTEAAALAQARRVEYRGVVSNAELASLRRDAVAVVMPNMPSHGTDFEGFGLAAVEAGADGGILLASGIEGIVDAVVDGVTGLLLPASDAHAWAAAVNDVLAWSPSRRMAFIRGCRAEIARRYTWPVVAERTMAAYGQPEATP
jgi:phosphatidyl-myo-inositol dimannoside synthase